MSTGTFSRLSRFRRGAQHSQRQVGPGDEHKTEHSHMNVAGKEEIFFVAVGTTSWNLGIPEILCHLSG
jgi:hypothetical protein